jgi:hypothetical protein
MASIRPTVLRALLAAVLTAACGLSASAQLLPIRQDGRWGLIDRQGQIVAQPRYDAVEALDSGGIRVVLNGKFGLLNARGQELIPPQFTFIKPLANSLWATNLGGSCEGSDCEGGKWGVFNIRTQQQIPPTYSLLLDAALPGFYLGNVGGECDYRDCKGGKWALIDSGGKVLLQPQYERVSPQAQNQAFIQRDNRWGLYDLTSKNALIAPQFTRLEYVTNRTVAAYRGDTAALLNLRGDTLIGFLYQGYKDAGDGLFQFRQQDAWGLIDSTGRVLIPAQYDQVLVRNADWIQVWKSGQIGLYTRAGVQVSPPIYREVKDVEGRIALVSQGLAWGAVSLDGRTILPIAHEKVGKTGDSLVYYYERNALKWVDLRGEVTKGINFDWISPFKRGVADVHMSGKVGLINQEGNWLIPMRYDEMNVFWNVAQARQKTDAEWTYFYFDDDGRHSMVKRIILMRNQDYEDQANSNALSNGGGVARNWGVSTVLDEAWFLGGKKQWGLRDPRTRVERISPRYSAVFRISQSDLYIVQAKMSGTETVASGIVHYTTARETIEPMFAEIFSEDLRNGPAIRAQYASNSNFTLILPSGRNAAVSNTVYIRPFSQDLAAACQGGRMQSSREPRMDTVSSHLEELRNTNTRERIYDFIEGGKWGYLDTLGRWIHIAEYEQALPFRNGLAVVKKGGKWGIIDLKFNFVVQPVYDFIEELYASNGKVLLLVGHQRSRFGFIDSLGDVVVQPQFQEAGTYFEGLVRVRIDGLWGYADFAGQVVIPPRYRQAGDFHEGRARVRNLRKWGYIDMQGNAVTDERFLRAGDFHEGRAWVQDGRMMGYLGRDGQLVVAATYTEAGDFSQGRASVRQKGGYGVIDSTGKWVLQPRFYRVHAFRDSIALVQDGPSHGIVRHDGTWLVKPRYRALGAFSEGRAAFRDGLEYGYLDSTGAVSIPAAYANVGSFSCGLAAVFVKGHWGFVDTTGTLVIPPQYSSVLPFTEGRAAVRVGRKWGFIDKTGNLLIPAEYDKVNAFYGGRAAVQLADHGWGFVNTDGTLVIPCTYNEVGKFQNGIVPVCKERKWGVLNQYGTLVTLMKYDQIGNYDQGMAKVNIQRSIGVVNQDGTVVVSPDFDSVRMIGNMIQAESNDALGYLNLLGEWVWQPTK